MKFVYIEAYGCSANISEYEMLSGMLFEKGFRVTNDANKSNVNIILTCAVKNPTSNRMAYRLKKLSELNKPLIVAGCMPEIEYARIKAISPDASMISTNHLKEIPSVVNKILNGERVELIGHAKEVKVCLPKIRKNPLVNIVQISSGCKSYCSYCCVKKAKGDLFSYNPDMIVGEIRNSLNEGCRELWLTSQDCGCYGLDINTNLVSLLREIVAIKGDFRIRIGMMNPARIKPILKELTEIYRNPKVYRFIHIPVQSGSDKILKMMKRGYTAKDFREIVGRFRGAIPGITLSTDVIAGFPGETEEDFEKTLSLIKKVGPDIVNVSKFGPRPGTEAASMKQLDNRTIKRRSKKLAHLVRKIGLEKNMEWIGRECWILVTEKGKKKNQFVGRNECYKPVIIEKKGNAIGKILKVKITKCGQSFLAARINRN